jgi:hypothetical protein
LADRAAVALVEFKASIIFLSLYADANTANNFLSLDEDGNISDTAINSISNQVVSRMRLGFPAGATIQL